MGKQPGPLFLFLEHKLNVRPFADGARWLARIDPAEAGVQHTYELPIAGPATIAILPPAAGTVLVEFSCSSTADLEAGTALFIPAEGLAEGGSVAQPTIDSIPSTVTAIRLTASAAGGRVEIAQ